MIKSNQLDLYNPKSQSHCDSGLYNLYGEVLPRSLELPFKWGKTLTDRRKKHFNRGKKKLEETSGRGTEHDPSPRTDRHEIDVACTEQNKITVYKLY